MLLRGVCWGATALLAVANLGCTIITTDGGASPSPRPRPHRQHHGQRPAPPPSPRGVPAPAPATTRVAMQSAAPELPPQPAKEAPPRTPTRPSTMAAGIAAGRPSGFTPGAPPAYWIWQGPRGGWRIRTTTKSAPHVFRGRITPVDTVVSAMSPSRTELRDQVWKSGNSWHFTFKTAGHADGFTFNTQGNGCVTFDLQLDGGPVPKRIIVGKTQASPPTNHFTLCPHGKTP